MTMSEKFIVPAGGGAGLRLEHGECLRVIDIEGGQTGDLVAFSADGKQRLCSGRTFDYGGKIYVSTGDVLWSDRSNPMLTIVADDVGKHDLLYAPCSLEMYRMQCHHSERHAMGLELQGHTVQLELQAQSPLLSARLCNKNQQW
jgi:uncharacterized protein